MAIPLPFSAAVCVAGDPTPFECECCLMIVIMAKSGPSFALLCGCVWLFFETIVSRDTILVLSAPEAMGGISAHMGVGGWNG